MVARPTNSALGFQVQHVEVTHVYPFLCKHVGGKVLYVEEFPLAGPYATTHPTNHRCGTSDTYDTWMLCDQQTASGDQTALGGV